MAALVAAIHVFRAVSKDVDGRHWAGHDDEKAPVAVTKFYRTTVTLCRPSAASAKVGRR
jgi:hypothetical protein